MSAPRRMPAVGASRDIHFPPIAKYTRGDGTRVWTVQHPGLPVVCLSVLWPIGSAVDPPDRFGLASLTTDLLDEGTRSLDGHALHDALARLGSHLEGEVGADAAALGLLTLTKNGARALALLADIACHPRFDAADFARVRDNRISRLVQMRDVPAAVAERVFSRQLYGDHPYGHSPVGVEASLRATTLADLQHFHADVLMATTPTILAVGDVPHAEVVDWVEAAWPARRPGVPDPATAATPPPVANGPSVSFVHRAAAAQSELRVGRIGAARATPDYAALAVMNTILGGTFVSRINSKLREEKGFTYGVRSSFDYRRQPGPFVVQTSVQASATTEAIADIVHEIRGIGGDRPPTAAELTRAQAALTRSYPRSFETAEQVTRAVAQLALHGLPDDYFDGFVRDVTHVTADQVVDVARRYASPDDLHVVVVGDRSHLDAAALGLGPAIERPLSDDGDGPVTTG
jgi:predicted Zn-dependent peptidase